jgi:hypothetical protein
MHLVKRASIAVDPSILQGPQRICSAGGVLHVAEGAVVSRYSVDMKLLSKVEAPAPIASMDASPSILLVLCENGRGYYRRAGGSWIALPGLRYLDPIDAFCVNDEQVWFVTRDAVPGISVLDPRTTQVVWRFALDTTWNGGSFHLWSGPPGTVAIEVAMDCKFGLANSRARSFKPWTNNGYMIGFHDGELAFVLDSFFTRSMLGKVTLEIEGHVPHGAAAVGDALLLVEKGRVAARVGRSIQKVDGIEHDGRDDAYWRQRESDGSHLR